MVALIAVDRHIEASIQFRNQAPDILCLSPRGPETVPPDMGRGEPVLTRRQAQIILQPKVVEPAELVASQHCGKKACWLWPTHKFCLSLGFIIPNMSWHNKGCRCRVKTGFCRFRAIHGNRELQPTTCVPKSTQLHSWFLEN